MTDPTWVYARTAAWIAATAISLAALIRWCVDRWTTRRGLVLAEFWSQEPDLSKELQNRIAAYLESVLTPGAAKRVNRLPAVVSAADRVIATRMLRRLRASYIVYGDIFKGSEKAKAEPHLLQVASRAVFHIDLFTNEVIPAFSRRSELAYRLATAPRVREYDFPPEFSMELQALMDVLASNANRLANDSLATMRFLRSAIRVCETVDTPAVDAMTADLARLVDKHEGPAQALELVHRRANRQFPSPAPDLLRAAYEFAFKLSELAPNSRAAHLHNEGVSWLQRAADQAADPERDVTLYNLAMAVDVEPGGANQDQALWLLEQVVSMSRYYRRAWYVHRHLGSIYWQKHLEDSDERTVEWAKAAAAYYARAIRKRPRARWFHLDHNGFYSIRRGFERFPIMYANAADAHRAAGHSWRGSIKGIQAARERRRMLRIATEAAARGEWARAYAYFDWSRIGWGDAEDVLAHVATPLSGERMNLQPRLVQDAWDRAYSRFPDVVDDLRSDLEERWP